MFGLCRNTRVDLGVGGKTPSLGGGGQLEKSLYHGSFPSLGGLKTSRNHPFELLRTDDRLGCAHAEVGSTEGNDLRCVVEWRCCSKIFISLTS
jgi:hypothetical protein